MDPLANITEQRQLAAQIVNGEHDSDHGAAERLAELVLALEEWRAKGGFDPSATAKVVRDFLARVDADRIEPEDFGLTAEDVEALRDEHGGIPHA